MSSSRFHKMLGSYLELRRVTRPNLGWVQCVLTSMDTELNLSQVLKLFQIRKSLVKSTAGLELLEAYEPRLPWSWPWCPFNMKVALPSLR